MTINAGLGAIGCYPPMSGSAQKSGGNNSRCWFTKILTVVAKARLAYRRATQTVASDHASLSKKIAKLISMHPISAEPRWVAATPLIPRGASRRALKSRRHLLTSRTVHEHFRADCRFCTRPLFLNQ